MHARKIVDGVFWVGVNDPDRKLFEEITPLPEGTSYNSYLVRGNDKIALIDTVEPDFCGVLLERLADAGVERLDYIVSNHAEQDHSGSIPMVLERFPEAAVLCTPRGKEMLLGHLDFDGSRVRTVEDNEEVDLGGRTLRFIHAPWIHWPETMFTWLAEDRILFSCDLFGSHMATNDLFVVDEPRVVDTGKRYYAEVMMPYAGPVRRNMARIEDYKISIIAPSHGPCYNRPELILDLYRDWAGDEPKNLLVLPYVSMHGSTRAMVHHFCEALLDRGVRVQPFNLADADVGRMSMALVDAASVVFGSPNVLNGMHPKVVYAAYLANALRIKARFATVIGSFAWSARMEDQLKGLLSGLKLEFLDAVTATGHPRDNNFSALDGLADTIAERHGRVCAGFAEAVAV
jgi:flavorubredoxin